jgi:hypothetical protein
MPDAPATYTYVLGRLSWLLDYGEQIADRNVAWRASELIEDVRELEAAHKAVEKERDALAEELANARGWSTKLACAGAILRAERDEANARARRLFEAHEAIDMALFGSGQVDPLGDEERARGWDQGDAREAISAILQTEAEAEAGGRAAHILDEVAFCFQEDGEHDPPDHGLLAALVRRERQQFAEMTAERDTLRTERDEAREELATMTAARDLAWQSYSKAASECNALRDGICSVFGFDEDNGDDISDARLIHVVGEVSDRHEALSGHLADALAARDEARDAVASWQSAFDDANAALAAICDLLGIDYLQAMERGQDNPPAAIVEAVRVRVRHPPSFVSSEFYARADSMDGLAMWRAARERMAPPLHEQIAAIGDGIPAADLDALPTFNHNAKGADDMSTNWDKSLGDSEAYTIELGDGRDVELERAGGEWRVEVWQPGEIVAADYLPASDAPPFQDALARAIAMMRVQVDVREAIIAALESKQGEGAR